MLSYLWLTFWALFGVSMFVSKSGISIFGTALILWSIFKVDWRERARSNPWFYVVIGFFPLAMFVSFLSIGGEAAAIKVLMSWSWPLYVIPFSVLITDRKALKVFIWSLVVGLLLGCAKALQIFAMDFQYSFAPGTRVASFWDIGRWGVFLSCSSVVLFSIMGNQGIWNRISKYKKIGIVCLFALSLIFLAMVNARGPWLASLVGIGVIGISGKRYFKCLLMALVLFAGSWVVIPGSLNRFKSSFNVKKENGVITSSDGSNAARLHMWKVAGDFFKEQPIFGTGFESAEKPMREFLAKQTTEYQTKYVDSEFSFNDQHNSYLWVLVQLGIIFFVIFWGVVGFLMFKATPAFFMENDLLLKLSYGLIVNQLFVYLFYSSVSSYETLWFFPMLWVLSQKRVRN